LQRFRQVVRALSIAYPIVLLASVAALRFLGQRFWQVELALYLPRIGFALPLPLFVIALLALRLRRLLWSQLIAALIVLFPLMGLVLPSIGGAASGAQPTLRVLTYNANFLYGGDEAVARQVLEFAPDVAVFQQIFSDHIIPLLRSRYREFRSDGDFLIASRFPLRSTSIPQKVDYHGERRGAHFIQYVLDTNLGPIVLYSVHPTSPLYQIMAARNGGFRRLIRSGELFSATARPDIAHDTGLRALQLRAAVTRAKLETLPVIIAGDTNLPTLSAPLAYLSAFQDGFAVAGAGFGYTFPSNHAWMRIDRIFASDALRFRRFEVGKSLASDHLCVMAELELRPR
jgi:endonuclease/exonuclease/phosphatase family metal-dependent hydrolase